MELEAGHPFGRWYHLTLKGLNGPTIDIETKRDHYAFDIKFDITKGVGQYASNGSLSILGLSRETIKPFADLAGIINKEIQDTYVSLDAGYFEGGFQRVKVFTGKISTVEVTKPPDIWLNLGVNEAFAFYEKAISHSINLGTGQPVSTVAANIVGRYGYGFSDLTTKAGKKKKEGTFATKPVTLIDALIELEKLTDWYLVIEQKTVVAYPKNYLHEKVKVNEIKLDAANGLLGVSGVTGNAAEVSTFLNDPQPHLCYANLESQIYHSVKGKYFIKQKRFHGHFRGDEWFTSYMLDGKIQE